MNRVQQNIKIAEFDGYKNPRQSGETVIIIADGDVGTTGVPNYFINYAAIKGAIEKLPSKYVFLNYLAKIKNAKVVDEYDDKGYCTATGYEDDGVISMILASPEELCEALLKTIEK